MSDYAIQALYTLLSNHLERKGSYYTTEYRCEEFVGIASTLFTWIHLKSKEKRSGLSELSVISWVSAVEGYPLSGVPLYKKR